MCVPPYSPIHPAERGQPVPVRPGRLPWTGFVSSFPRCCNKILDKNYLWPPTRPHLPLVPLPLGLWELSTVRLPHTDRDIDLAGQLASYRRMFRKEVALVPLTPAWQGGQVAGTQGRQLVTLQLQRDEGWCSSPVLLLFSLLQPSGCLYPHVRQVFSPQPSLGDASQSRPPVSLVTLQPTKLTLLSITSEAGRGEAG